MVRKAELRCIKRSLGPAKHGKYAWGKPNRIVFIEIDQAYLDFAFLGKLFRRAHK